MKPNKVYGTCFDGFEPRKTFREEVGDDEYLAREREFLKDNHASYLSEALHIGFTDRMPESKDDVVDEFVSTGTCRGFGVKVNVRLTKVSFGNGEYKVSAIVTDQVRVSHMLPLGGWNSHAYTDEAKFMELAVVAHAKKHGLMIVKKLCSWPFAKAIVQPVSDAHVRCFEKNSELLS